VKNLPFLVPLVMILVGAYVLIISIGGGDSVMLVPGHEVPSRFGLLLGGIGLFGGIVVGVEMVSKARKQTALRTGQRS
jgi:hypothetical protein